MSRKSIEQSLLETTLNIDFTEPMSVYSITGKIMAGMLNGTIDWEEGNIVRKTIFKIAKEVQMRKWNL